MAGECGKCDTAGKVFCHCDGPGLKTGAKNIKRIAQKATPIGQMLSGKNFGEAQIDSAKNLGKVIKESWTSVSPLGQFINWLKN